MYYTALFKAASTSGMPGLTNNKRKTFGEEEEEKEKGFFDEQEEEEKGVLKNGRNGVSISQNRKEG